MTEAGFVRILSNPSFSRDFVSPPDAVHILSQACSAKDHIFWEDDTPLSVAIESLRPRLMGHRQVTDAYLLGIAIRRQASLATLDRGIQSLLVKKSEYRRRLELVN